MTEDTKKLVVKTERNFTAEQTALIKSQIAVGATDEELALFMYQAKRTGLDPMARQIYFIKRNVKQSDGTWKGKATIQASIDGFRVIAEKSGEYAGQDEPEFVEDDKGVLLYCKVCVYKWHGDTRYQAAVGIAYWKEYCPSSGQDFMWLKMPHTMLAKVAEALALRKAFPQDLSGLYTQEEMEQSDVVIEGKVEAKTASPKTSGYQNTTKETITRKASEAQLGLIYVEMNKQGFDETQSNEALIKKFGLKDLSELTSLQASSVIKSLKEKNDKKEWTEKTV